MNQTTSSSAAALHAIAITCALMFIMCGCTVGPNYKAPNPVVPDAFSELVTVESTTRPANGNATTQASFATGPLAPMARWWHTFNDPALDELMVQAVRANPNLRRAQARVIEARSQRGVVAADYYPGVDVTGSHEHSRTSSNGIAGGNQGAGGGSSGGPPSSSVNFPREHNLYQAGFDATWELDVFGGVRRNIEAAEADIAAAIEDRRDVLVSLLAEVARNYIELRGAQRQAAIARQNLKAQQGTVQLTRDRMQAGLASDLDVARAEAQAATTAAEIPTLETTARQSIHRISVLLGMQPQALSEQLSNDQPIPAPPPLVPVGVPSQLLRRRPDVRRAERELAAANARIGVATADLFPRFSLTGSFGFESTESERLPRYDSRFWNVGPAIRWPIFDAGRIRSNIAVQNARQEAAAALYEQTVLTSLQDVEDALVAYGKEQARRTSLSEAAAANRRAVGLANQLYAAGRTDFLSVLQAQRDLFASEDALVQSDRTVSANLVSLYKALGGGWEIESAAAPAQVTHAGAATPANR